MLDEHVDGRAGVSGIDHPLAERQVGIGLVGVGVLNTARRGDHRLGVPHGRAQVARPRVPLEGAFDITGFQREIPGLQGQVRRNRRRTLEVREDMPVDRQCLGDLALFFEGAGLVDELRNLGQSETPLSTKRGAHRRSCVTKVSSYAP
ncbi:MAG: hypothetical protein EXR93_08155 [Gemmatimonadetes bacterium]|nr:hypothetical protein [Gemmatimonadota bacterium]